MKGRRKEVSNELVKMFNDVEDWEFWDDFFYKVSVNISVKIFIKKIVKTYCKNLQSLI